MSPQLHGFFLFLAEAPADRSNYLITLVIGIIIFVAMIIGARFLLKWVANRPLPKGSHIRILDRISVINDCTLMLVEVAGKVLLIGVSKEKTSFLCELDSELIGGSPDFTSQTGTPSPAASSGEEKDTTFSERFFHNLKLAAGLAPKGSQPLRPNASKKRNIPSQNDAMGQVPFISASAQRQTPPAANTQRAGVDFKQALDVVMKHQESSREPEQGQATPRMNADYAAAAERVKQLSQVDESKSAERVAAREAARQSQAAQIPRMPEVFTPAPSEESDDMPTTAQAVGNELRADTDNSAPSTDADTNGASLTGSNMTEKQDTASKEQSPDLDELLDLVSNRTERYTMKSGEGGVRNQT